MSYVHGKERMLLQAGGVEVQTGGMLPQADQEVPRGCETTSVRETGQETVINKKSP